MLAKPGKKAVPLAVGLVCALLIALLTAGRLTLAQAGTGSPPALHFDAYEPQKAVYHVTSGGGWFGREHTHLLTVLRNHMNAVGPGFLDVRVVMQGDGVDLMIAARKDAKLAEAIDRLIADGATFVVCYNTLVQRRIDPARDMHRVSREEIVGAGVAEVPQLVAKGYVYLRI